MGELIGVSTHQGFKVQVGEGFLKQFPKGQRPAIVRELSHCLVGQLCEQGILTSITQAPGFGVSLQLSETRELLMLRGAYATPKSPQVDWYEKNDQLVVSYPWLNQIRSVARMDLPPLLNRGDQGVILLYEYLDRAFSLDRVPQDQSSLAYLSLMSELAWRHSAGACQREGFSLTWGNLRSSPQGVIFPPLKFGSYVTDRYSQTFEQHAIREAARFASEGAIIIGRTNPLQVGETIYQGLENYLARLPIYWAASTFGKDPQSQKEARRFFYTKFAPRYEYALKRHYFLGSRVSYCPN